MWDSQRVLLAPVTEDLNKRREPMPGQAGVYFISPKKESVQRLIFDFGATPMYRAAHVFFSSRPSPALLDEIRGTPGLMAKLKCLKEASPEPPPPLIFHRQPQLQPRAATRVGTCLAPGVAGGC
jgi:hypothetical protein